MTAPEPKDYVIVLDDDAMICKIIEKFSGFKALPFTSCEKLLARAASFAPAAAFIDIHLGVDDNGLDIIPKLRQIWPLTPIIVQTSDPQPDLVGQALAAGANDFIRKPLSQEELVGRMQARISEMRERAGSTLQRVGDLTFNYKLRYLEKNGRKAYVSPIESELLQSLASAQGTVVGRDILKRKLWGDVKVSDNALDRRISELRKSLKDLTPNLRIRSIYGTGVILEKKTEEEFAGDLQAQ